MLARESVRRRGDGCGEAERELILELGSSVVVLPVVSVEKECRGSVRVRSC